MSMAYLVELSTGRIVDYVDDGEAFHAVASSNDTLVSYRLIKRGGYNPFIKAGEEDIYDWYMTCRHSIEKHWFWMLMYKDVPDVIKFAEVIRGT